MGPGLKGLFKHDKLKNGKKPTEANIKAHDQRGRQRNAVLFATC